MIHSAVSHTLHSFARARSSPTCISEIIVQTVMRETTRTGPCAQQVTFINVGRAVPSMCAHIHACGHGLPVQTVCALPICDYTDGNSSGKAVTLGDKIAQSKAAHPPPPEPSWSIDRPTMPLRGPRKELNAHAPMLTKRPAAPLPPLPAAVYLDPIVKACTVQLSSSAQSPQMAASSPSWSPPLLPSPLTAAPPPPWSPDVRSSAPPIMRRAVTPPCTPRLVVVQGCSVDADDDDGTHGNATTADSNPCDADVDTAGSRGVLASFENDAELVSGQVRKRGGGRMYRMVC